MHDLMPGARLRSLVCTTEVVVVLAPKTAVALQCGGHEMTAIGGAIDSTSGEGLTLDPEFAKGSLLGKRYVAGQDEMKLELLCTKAGAGSLAVNGTALLIKESKALPSSD